MKYLPRVFTEQGVAMLATILKSKIATETSIRIMDAFVLMRHSIVDNKDVYKSLNNINNKLIEHDEKLNYLFSKFDKKEQLFLPGETYDAYSEIIDILNKPSNEIIIIDSYADKTLLDFIKNIDTKITVITSNKTRLTVTLIVKEKSKLNKTDIEKYNSQYDNLKLIYSDSFHDRYIIIDEDIIYHCGASINHAGKRAFGIDIIGEEDVKITLLNKIREINSI